MESSPHAIYEMVMVTEVVCTKYIWLYNSIFQPFVCTINIYILHNMICVYIYLLKSEYGCQPKNRGFYPEMDGL